MIKPLEYDFDNGTHVNFSKYTIDTSGVVRNQNEDIITHHKIGKYNAVTVRDDTGKRRGVRVTRAIASTFIGPPPTIKHTADHKNKNPNDDTVENIRWLFKSGQVFNQDRTETLKTALVIVKDDIEKTAKEWVEYLKGEKNMLGRDHTMVMISNYQRMHSNKK